MCEHIRQKIVLPGKRVATLSARPVCRAASWLALLGAVLLLSGLSGCRTRSFLSTKQEIGLGKEGAHEVEQEFRIASSDADADRVRRIGQSLLPHMDRRDVPYSFKVIDAPEVNAFSLPGGPVYVYRGLLDMIDDDDELACVMAHECGHINARHVARRISSEVVNTLAIDLLIPNATVANTAGLLDEIIGLKYSRDDEYEADRRGLSYAHFAHYDPRGMSRFFAKLQRMEKRQGGGDPEWLRDHPLTKERIAKVEAMIEHSDFRYGQ